MYRGALIISEGVDKVGKLTQAVRRVEGLRSQSYSSHLMNFPNRSTHIGQIISQYLKGDKHIDDRVIHLLFSANRWEMRPKLEELLTSSTSVIVDTHILVSLTLRSKNLGKDSLHCRPSSRNERRIK